MRVATIFRRRPPSKPGMARALALSANTIRLPDSRPGVTWGSTTRRITLHPDDLAAADRLPIRAISVIPTVNLDEATVVRRFGDPGERIVVSDRRTHLLYPKLGLDVVVDQDGKELLQYVAPRDFAMLRAPLVAAGESRAPAQ